MVESFAQKPIEAVCKDWQKLKASLYECDDIRLEFFQEVFSSTEQYLRHCISAKSIDKEYIPLIVDAFAFVDADAGDKNARIQAAKILTERMLYQYTVSSDVTEQNADRVTVYLLKRKRQVTFSFGDVELALATVMESL